MNQTEYLKTISAIKSEIKSAQYRAMFGANRELITLYWRIGKMINAHKTWGNKFVENLAADIKLEFPDATGYSTRNLKYMAKLAAKYTNEEFVQQVVAQIPWGQNVVLLDKVPNDSARLWYINACARNGWSRNIPLRMSPSRLASANTELPAFFRKVCGISCQVSKIFKTESILGSNKLRKVSPSGIPQINAILPHAQRSALLCQLRWRVTGQFCFCC